MQVELAADVGVLLEQIDGVAFARELNGGGHAAKAGADDDGTIAGLRSRTIHERAPMRAFSLSRRPLAWRK